MNNSPPFKRHSVGRTYPWQVAPQQSLLPFRFNNTKFKSVNYIYNLSKFPATFNICKGKMHSLRSPLHIPFTYQFVCAPVGAHSLPFTCFASHTLSLLTRSYFIPPNPF